MHEILISRDSKNKIRIVDISCRWNDTIHGFVLMRKTGMWNGKMTSQPVIEIKQGKVKRTVVEQATLEFNSHIKKYLDIGYKNIKDFGINDITDQDLDKLLGKTKEDQNGAPKPMLAKSYDGINSSVFDKDFYCSNKIDGVRCLMHWNGEKIITASRGGGDYDVATTYIRSCPYLVNYLKSNPNIWLDGELYVTDRPLSFISGAVRLKDLDDKHKALQYFVYDLAIPDKKFSERLELLHEFAEAVKDSDKIVMVEHVKAKGFDTMMKMHNERVALGWEGLVIRDPDQDYKFAGRDKRMIKIKVFSDAEFKILDLVDGLRDEDMCFLMETKEGYQFKAKPVGDRALKQWYRDHINDIKGQMGTVKYFGMTTTEQPVPNLPVFKSCRFSEDM